MSAVACSSDHSKIWGGLCHGSASLVTGGTPQHGLLCQEFPHWSTGTHLISTPRLFLLCSHSQGTATFSLSSIHGVHRQERERMCCPFPGLEPGKTHPKSFPSLAKAGISAVQSLFSTLFSIIPNSHGTEAALGMVPYHGPSQIKHTPFSPRQGSLRQDSGKKNKKIKTQTEMKESCRVSFAYLNKQIGTVSYPLALALL